MRFIIVDIYAYNKKNFNKVSIIIINEKATLLAIKYNYQNLLVTNDNTHTMNTTYGPLKYPQINSFKSW